MFFRSRYVLRLEKELAEIEDRHRKELERIKTAHAEELTRAINEANRGWAEADRLRQFVVPGLPQSARTTDVSNDSSPPKSEPVEPGGTPFQRAAAKFWEEQKAVAKEAERLRKAREQFPTPQESKPVAPA